MRIVYAYPSDRGSQVEAEVLRLLRARFGGAEQTASEVRGGGHGGGATLVTVEVGEVHTEAALATIRSNPAVLDAAAESFGERV